ncbi:hypothetical protein [Hydrotalea sp.]|uniref:hypothetical protein n=1 Tax=Hydrotalea sp. TaxID=2881279 RepID=UPI003D116182
MKIHFSLKHFIIGSFLLFPVLLILDGIYDYAMNEWNTTTLFSTENLIFKAIAAVIGGYFYARIIQFYKQNKS